MSLNELIIARSLAQAVEAVLNHDWELLLEPEASGDDSIIRIMDQIYTMRGALDKYRAWANH